MLELNRNERELALKAAKMIKNFLLSISTGDVTTLVDFPIGVIVTKALRSETIITLTGAASYETQVAEDVTFSNPTVGTNSDGSVEFGDGIDPVENFYYRARKTGTDVWYNVGTTGLVEIEPIENISVSGLMGTAGNTQSTINWDNAPQGATTYTIETSLDNISFSVFSAIATTPTLVTGLTNDVVNYIKVMPNPTTIDFNGISVTTEVNPVSPAELVSPTLNNISDDGAGGSINVVTAIINAIPSGADTYEWTVDSVIEQDTASTTLVLSNKTDNDILNFSVIAKKAGFANSAPLVFNYTVNPIMTQVTIESYGGESFYRHYPQVTEVRSSLLTITPHAVDGSVGIGNSRITYEGTGSGEFDSSYVGKSFMAYDSHKHPSVESGTGDYFPNVVGGAFSTVLSVEDADNLIVNLEYNGGVTGTPIQKTGMAGCFFFDNSQAIFDAISDTNRPTEITFLKNKTYAYKKSWGVMSPENFKLVTENGYLPSEQFRLKWMAEDGIDGTTFGNEFIDVNARDGVSYIIQGHMLPPVYAVPTVQGGLTRGYFKNSDTVSQWAGTLKIEDSDDWLEKDEFTADGTLALMPQRYTFVSPSFVDNIMYGGKRSGDTVSDDVTGFVFLDLTKSNLHTKAFSSVKANICAGIYKRIIGTSPTNMNSLVELDIPSNLANSNAPVKLGISAGTNLDANADITIKNDPETSSNRRMSVGNIGSINQITNQYFNGGTSFSSTAPNQLLVPDGVGGHFTFDMGNNADWRIIDPGATIGGYISSSEARMFTRLPQISDTIQQSAKGGGGEWLDNVNNGIIGKVSDTKFEIWGWGLQIGDVLTYNLIDYTITNRIFKSRQANVYDSTQGYSSAWYIHYYEIEIDSPITDGDDVVVFTVKTSQSASVLNTEKQCLLRYNRDQAGHIFYDDFNMPFWFENTIIRGYYRGSDRVTGGKLFNMCPIDNGYGKRFINVDYDDDNPNPQQWSGTTLRERATTELIAENSYPILIDGSNTLITRMYPISDIVDFVEFRSGVNINGCRVTNPIIPNGALLNTETSDFNFTDGVARTFSIAIITSESNPRRVRIISGNNTSITITNFTSSANGSSDYGVLMINQSTNGSSTAPANGKNTIVVTQGEGAIVLNDNPVIADQSINIQSWTTRKGLFVTNGIFNQWATTDPNYNTNVLLNGSPIP